MIANYRFLFALTGSQYLEDRTADEFVPEFNRFIVAQILA
jgi:hypothetical protein